ncbi:MAG: hypothetical protein Q4C67_09355, partial [Deinococcus sp.]|nr:hypothetical protein [Deinococcus sp.]
KAIDRKNRLNAATDRVIDLMEQIALVAVGLPVPTPEELGAYGPEDPLYAERKAEYFSEAADLVMKEAEKGLFVGPVGTEFEIQNITHSLAGLPDVIKENNRQAWTALGTTGFMRGSMDSTTEALAKIVYPMVEARATNIQQVLARQLEFGVNLNLRLKGINATAYVKFQQAESAFQQAEAEAFLTEMQAHEIGKRLAGKAYARRFADTLDLSDEEDVHAPPWADGWAVESPPDPQPPPPSPASGAGTLVAAADAVRWGIRYDRQARGYISLSGKETP